jgi:ferrous iron transport protein A
MSHLEPLSNLHEGETGVIRTFTDDQMASKLLAMGMLPGKLITLVRRMSLKGGIYLKVEDQTFAVREEEARNIILELKGEPQH